MQRFYGWRSVWRICVVSVTMVAVLPLASGGAQASALGDAAASMQAGEWRLLTTNNINPTLSAGGAGGIVFGYTEDIKWDPVSRQLLYAGGDHNDLAQFVTYRESTNTWQRMARPDWMGSGTMHGYDHHAIDVQGRYFYHRPYNRVIVQRYDIDTGVWSALATPPSSVIDYVGCCVGVEWFPEMGALVHVSVNGLAKYTPGTGWSRVTQAVLPMGNLHNFAEYNPVHKVMIFGGGNGSRSLYKLAANGQVTTLNQAPVDIGVQMSMTTVDPLSGDYLVFTSNRQFYVYDVVADTWALQSNGTSLPIWTTQYSNAVAGVVVTPVSTYGLILFVTCNGSNNCRVHLYKHAPGAPPAPPPPPVVPASPTSLEVS